MLQIVSQRSILNNVYTVMISTTNFDDTDVKLFTEFGEPIIEIGGDIFDSTGTKVATLPSQQVFVRKQFPVTQRFPDQAYGGNAQAIAMAWQAQVEQNIKNAILALRAKTDNFTGTDNITV